MAVITYLDPLAVFESLLLGKQAVTDATRKLGQEQIAKSVETRVHRGRKGMNTQKDSILLSITGNLTEMLLSGEDDCTDTFVLVRCLSPSDYRAGLVNEAVRQLVSAYRGTVTTGENEVTVVIIPTDKDSPEPEPPDDGSPWFDFEVNLVYRVVHTQVSPTGAN